MFESHPVVHVWVASLHVDHARFRSITRTLTTDEWRRANSFRFDQDRRRFIVARAFLRAVLGRWLSVEPAAVRLGYGSHGKPFLAAPRRLDLRFNASHSGDLELVALTQDVDLGVDIEMVRTLPARQELADRYFASEEAAAIRRLPESCRDLAFFRCWTRKEAYIKALGTGLSERLHAFEVSVGPGGPSLLRTIRGSAAEAAEWSLHDVSQLPDYAAAVAVRNPRASLVLRSASEIAW